MSISGYAHPIVPELRALEAAATAKLEADLIALLQKHFGGEAFTALQIAEKGTALSREEFRERLAALNAKLDAARADAEEPCPCPTCTAKRAAAE